MDSECAGEGGSRALATLREPQRNHRRRGGGGQEPRGYQLHALFDDDWRQRCRDGGVDMTKEEALETLDMLYESISSIGRETPVLTLQRIMEEADISSNVVPDPSVPIRWKEENTTNILALELNLLKHKLIGFQAPLEDGVPREARELIERNNRRLNKILRVIALSAHAMANVFGVMATLEQAVSTFPKEISTVDTSPMDWNNLQNIHLMLMTIYQSAHNEGLRHIGNMVYKQKVWYNPDEPDKPINTHCWKHECNSTDLPRRYISRNGQYEMWMHLVAHPQSANTMAHLMATMSEPNLFPELEMDRHVFSFTNGVYDVKENVFYTYDARETEDGMPQRHATIDNIVYGVPDDKVAVNFFPVKFDAEMYFSTDDFMDVETEAVTKIMTDQGWPKAVQRVYWSLWGRMFFWIKEMEKDDRGNSVMVGDNLQIAPFIRGVAGCGKSTLAELILRCYPDWARGFLSNNVEAKFGFSIIARSAMVFIMPELKKSFTGDQSELQLAIEGGHMALAVKNKDPWAGIFQVPGIICGNEVGFEDPGGAMTRRLAGFVMSRVIRNVDTTLNMRADEQVAANIYKAAQARRWLLERLTVPDPAYPGRTKTKDFFATDRRGNSLLGTNYFLDTRENLACSLDPRVEFMKFQIDQQIYVLDDKANGMDQGWFIPVNQLRTHFSAWAKVNGIRDVTYNPKEGDTGMAALRVCSHLALKKRSLPTGEIELVLEGIRLNPSYRAPQSHD